MPLMGSGNPELDFNNTEVLNGLEVWRKLAVPLASKSLPRRYALRDKTPTPKQCSSFAGVLEQVKQWKKDLMAYVAAGGSMPVDEDKRYSLIKMLPGSLSLEMKTKACDNETFDELYDWIVAQDEFQQEYGSKGIHLNEMAQSQPPSQPDEDVGEEECEPEESDQLSPEQLSVMSPSEICAVVNKRLASGGRQTQRGRNMARRKDGAANQARRTTAPSQAQARRCINCGLPGHLAVECKKPKKSGNERLCFKC